MKNYTYIGKASHQESLPALLLAQQSITNCVLRNGYKLFSYDSKCVKNENTDLFDATVEVVYKYEKRVSPKLNK